MKRTSYLFKLVPSVQMREEIPAPFSFRPALPVELAFIETEKNINTYAIIDTNAEVSVLPSDFAKVLGISMKNSTGQLKIKTANGVISSYIVNIDLIIYDNESSPWLNFHAVPFVVLPIIKQVLLGYDSCLSNLKLTIDFEKESLRLSAPSRFLIQPTDKVRYEMPLRILEGKNLIKSGNYNAAVVVIAAGLEEAILKYLDVRPKYPTLGKLTQLLSEQGFPPQVQQLLNKLIPLRNNAVHGSLTITLKDAKAALDIATKVIKHLQNLSLGTKG